MEGGEGKEKGGGEGKGPNPPQMLKPGAAYAHCICLILPK